MASEGLLKRETKVKYVEDDVCDDTLVIDQMFTQWRGQSEYHRSLFREKLGILWWDQHSPNVVTGFHLFLLLWIMKAWLTDKAVVSFLCRLLLIFHVLDCLESLSHHWAPFLARILLTNLLLNYIGTTRTHCSEVVIAGIQRSFTPSGCFTLQLFSKLNDQTVPIGAAKVGQCVYQTNPIDFHNWPELTSSSLLQFPPKYIDDCADGLSICIEFDHTTLFDFNFLLLYPFVCFLSFTEVFAQSLIVFDSCYNPEYHLAVLSITFSDGSHFI